MVVLPPGTYLIPFRGIALRGEFYSRERNGRLYVARWPKKQKTARTAAERDNRKLLAQAASITKVMSSQEQQFAREFAAATKLSARDLLMISLFNRLGWLVLRDGRKVFSMASYQDVSTIIDALGQTPGDLLYRGPTWWTNIPIGAEGDLLVVGPDGLPVWEAPAPAPSSGQPFMAPFQLKPTVAGVTVNPGNFSAVPIMSAIDVEVTGIRVPVKAAGSGRTITGGIYADVSGVLSGGALQAQSSAIAAATGVLELPFSAPITLTANRFYYMGILVLSGSGNVQLMPSNVTNNDFSFFAQASSTLPSTAPTATTGTGATQFTWWGY